MAVGVELIVLVELFWLLLMALFSLLLVASFWMDVGVELVLMVRFCLIFGAMSEVASRVELAWKVLLYVACDFEQALRMGKRLGVACDFEQALRMGRRLRVACVGALKRKSGEVANRV